MNLASYLVFPTTRNGSRNDEFSHIPDPGSVAPGRCCILCPYRGGRLVPHPGRFEAVLRCSRPHARSAPSFPHRSETPPLPVPFPQNDSGTGLGLHFDLAGSRFRPDGILFDPLLRTDSDYHCTVGMDPCPISQGVTRPNRYRIPYSESFRRRVLTPIPRTLAAWTLFFPL